MVEFCTSGRILHIKSDFAHARSVFFRFGGLAKKTRSNKKNARNGKGCPNPVKRHPNQTILWTNVSSSIVDLDFATQGGFCMPHAIAITVTTKSTFVALVLQTFKLTMFELLCRQKKL